MIPELLIKQWGINAPWQTLAMIEQDLIISRALVELYKQPKIQTSLAFRGGTALNKLFLKPPSRYSEDIDFVQTRSEPIGETITGIRQAMDHWLGEPIRIPTLSQKWINCSKASLGRQLKNSPKRNLNVIKGFFKNINLTI